MGWEAELRARELVRTSARKALRKLVRTTGNKMNDEARREWIRNFLRKVRRANGG